MSIASLRAAAVTGERVVLRELRESDLHLTFHWRNDQRSLKWFKSASPLQMDSHVAWFRRYMASETRDCMFFVETLDGAPVGQSSIYNFNDSGDEAEVGRFLSDPDVRGQGLFREGLLLTLKVAFQSMGLVAVHLEVLDSNERAIRLYESVGFLAQDRSDGLLAMRLERERFLTLHGDVMARAEGVAR